jgi:hypothetical protein
MLGRLTHDYVLLGAWGGEMAWRNALPAPGAAARQPLFKPMT